MIDLILIESDGKREREKEKRLEKKHTYISLVEEKMISKKTMISQMKMN